MSCGSLPAALQQIWFQRQAEQCSGSVPLQAAVWDKLPETTAELNKRWLLKSVTVFGAKHFLLGSWWKIINRYMKIDQIPDRWAAEVAAIWNYPSLHCFVFPFRFNTPTAKALALYYKLWNNAIWSGGIFPVLPTQPMLNWTVEEGRTEETNVKSFLAWITWKIFFKTSISCSFTTISEPHCNN